MSPSRTAIAAWRDNPRKYVWDNFKVDPDVWQGEALDAFASNDPAKMRISLQACAGPGKSAVMTWCGWNFLSCYGEKGEHPKGAAMSITSDNLKDNMWAEFSKWQSRSDYLRAAFRWTSERIFALDHPQTWFISARSFPKTANAEEQGRTLSGLHSKYVLYLIDESGDISPNVLKSAEQGLSTGPKFGKILQAGNPTSHSGMLYAAATQLRDKWFIIRITGDPDDPRRSKRIDITWAGEQIRLWGRDNPWVMSFILGLFPPGGINSLLGPEDVEAAMRRHLKEEQYAFSQRRLGVDVARYGDDRTVIFPRQGLAAFRPIIMRGASTDQIAARVMMAKNTWDADMELVDGSGGWGAGVVDSMRLARATPIEVMFSGKAIDPRFHNKRAEMYFEMADWVKRGGALPNLPELVKELTQQTYTIKNGKFLMEEKEQIKQRLGFSPDLGDGLALTFGMPDQPRHKRLPGGYVLGVEPARQQDYNPYDSQRLKNR